MWQKGNVDSLGVTHILMVTLTDGECHALYDLLSQVTDLKHDPLGATAGRKDRVSATRGVLSQLHGLVATPHLF